MNEFIDLIFSQNDGLNVDLSKIPSIQHSKDLFMKGHEDHFILSDIRRDAEGIKQNRTINQWKLFIQKNLNNISLDLLNADSGKSYQVEAKEFYRVLEKRVRIPEYLKNEGNQLE